MGTHEAQQSAFREQLTDATAEKSVLESQLQAADDQIHMTDTQLQASRLNMRYLKVRQQLAQASPALTYIQAYEVSCGPEGGSNSPEAQLDTRSPM